MNHAPATGWVVRKPFTLNGKGLRAGSRFDIAKAGLSERKLDQLVRGRFIIPAPKKETSEAPGG